MNSSISRALNPESKQEFGALLLLDQLMRYDLPLQEKNDLSETVNRLEKEVAELKKCFFHSDEQEQELNFRKQDLSEAQDALAEIEKEMAENEDYRLSLVLSGADDEGLEPLLKSMEERGILTVSDDNFYDPTDKGRETYGHLVQQLEAYTVHFDVYAYVDLEEGTFGEPESDLLEGEQWSDLRVAVAEHKGIDPCRVVFLAMLSGENFYENPDWKFDLAMGTLFNEMEQIIQDQLSVEDLGYENDEGEVSGEEVIRDIIEQGGAIAEDRHQRQLETEEKAGTSGAKQTEASPDEQIITTTYYW